MDKKLVVVVCNGNIHRSVVGALCLAREVARLSLDHLIEVTSRGLQGTMDTVPPAFPNLRAYPEYVLSKPSLDEIGIEIPEQQRSLPIDSRMVQRASLLLAMDNRVLSGRDNSLTKQFPSATSKMVLMYGLVGLDRDIADLFGSTDPVLHRFINHEIDIVARCGIPTLCARLGVALLN